MSLSGMAQIHVELTSRCEKRTLCAFCGHQRQDVNPITYGDMDYDLLVRIREQLEPGVVVEWHRDGEPTAYPRLRDALSLFRDFSTCLVTHGLNLTKRADEIIDLCTTVTVSVFRGDPDGGLQYETVKEFLRLKGDRAPRVQIKIVGDYPEHPYANFANFGIPILHRLIHAPTGNTHYAHRLPTVPEVGICLDALHRPSIDWEGRVHLCNRLDADRDTQIGDLRCQTLEEIWNGPIRHKMIEAHKEGRRDLANELCAKCTFYGVPSQWTPSRELPMVNA